MIERLQIEIVCFTRNRYFKIFSEIFVINSKIFFVFNFPGITGCIGAVIYGIYNYRNRGAMSTSVYLMHLRVKAQGMVVGSLTIGVAYNIIRRIMSTNDNEKKE